MIKDLEVTIRLGRDAHVPMAAADAALGLYRAMARDYGGDADVDMVLRLVEQQSGVAVVGSAKAA